MDSKGYGQIGRVSSIRFFTVFIIASQVLGLAAVVMVAVWMGRYRNGFAWTSNPELEFNYHPLFMVIGIVFLNAEALLSYRVFRDLNKPVLKLLHASVHIAAAIFIIVGLKAVFDSHNLVPVPKANLYTLHSWVGLTTVILFGIQWMSGFISFMFPKLSMDVRQLYMPAHRYFGLAIFAMAIATSLMGITEKALWSIGGNYSGRGPEATLVNMLGLVLVAFGLVVGYIVSNENYRRQPHPEEEVLPLN